MSDLWGINLDLEDFDRLLRKDDLEEAPVSIETFVTDKRYLGLPALSEIQLEIVRHNTQILKPHTLVKLMGEQKGMEYYHKYTVNEVIAQLGKGSGKDHVSRISMAYVVYLMHCLRDPLDYYNKAGNINIALINLAVNAKQAQQVFFEPFKNLLLNSPYFNEHPFDPRVQELHFFERPVRCFSGHSESEGWEGYDVMLCVLDEISAFKTDSEMQNSVRQNGSASQIYNMAKASVISRFPDVGKVILLSFPRFKGDFIQERYNEYIEKSPPKTWGLKKATWEVNPTITREDLEPEFIRNPIEAAARFGCEPPEMEDAYFRDVNAVRTAFTYGDNPIDENGHWKKWFNGSDNFPRFIHVDLGLKRDAAALAMAHVSGMKEVKTTAGIETLPMIYVDLVYRWQAPYNGEVDFAAVRSLIVELSRKFDIAGVTFDMWQCQMYNTLVPTSNGLVEICDVNPGLTVSSLAGAESATNNCDSGIVPLIKIKVKNGYYIYVTKEHKLYIDESSQWSQKKPHHLKWKKAGDLQVGDKLVLKSANLWSDKKLVSGAEAALLGFMLAEGRKTKYQLVVNNVDLDVLDVMEQILKEISHRTQINFASMSRKEKIQDKNAPRQYCEELAVYGKDFMEYLESIGLKNVGSFDKEVPSTVLQSGRQVQKEFLIGLFDGDAGITTQSGHVSIEYNSRSERLVDQVHQMLLNFGIVASKTEVSRNGLPMYRLYMTGAKAIKFIDEIGFLSSRKIEKSHRLKNLTKSSRKPRYTPDDDGFFSCPVTSIEDGFIDQAFDISVPGSESFVANGFVSHNSVDMIQSLKLQGIPAEWHTVRKTDYDTLGTAIYDGRVRGYWDEHLVEQELLKLKLITNTKVDHPTQGSKDAADAVAGSVFRCVENAGSAHELEIEIWRDGDFNKIEGTDIADKIVTGPTISEQAEPEGIREWLMEWL